MKNNYDFIIGISGFAVGLLGVGYAIGKHNKMNDICARLDKSINEIADDMEINLPDTIVNASVNKAVEKEAEIAVKRAIKQITYDIERDISAEVKNAVVSKSQDIKKAVAEEISKQVSRIRIEDMKAEVIEKAKIEVSDKLDKNLDGILEKFNDDLDNVSKIYKSIANAMSK